MNTWVNPVSRSSSIPAKLSPYARFVYKCVSNISRTQILVVLAFIMPVALTCVFTLAPAHAQQTAPGDLDPSFGGAGEVTTSFSGFGDQINALVLQPDGNIVAAGFTTTAAVPAGSSADDNQEFALARYNSNGSLDTTFGTGGKVATGFFGFQAIATSVLLQPDGKIVAAGYAAESANNSGSQDFALARYNTDGTLDTTFGNGGKVTTDFAGRQDQAFAVALQSNGQIVAAGLATETSALNQEFALARYNTDGSIDTTFGSAGKVANDFFGMGSSASCMVLQPDGAIVLAGSAISANGVSIAVARYTTDGSLDPSFNRTGTVVDFFTVVSAASCVALQPNGQIVVAGNSTIENQSGSVVFVDMQFAVARFNTDGSLDSTFGNDGNATAPGFTTSVFFTDNAASIAIQPDGKIVLAGSSDATINAANTIFQEQFGLARFTGNGQLDTTFGTAGEVLTPIFGTTDFGTSVILQPDAKIVVGGGSVPSSGFGEFALARYFAGPIPGDYSVSATPDSQMVTPGQSTNYTINLQLPPGTTGETTNVSLSAAVSPATPAITAKLSESSVTLPGSATLDVTTTSAAPQGTYSITVTSQAGSVIQLTTVSLQVVGPSFSLSFSAPTITAKPGTKVAAVVNINRVGGLTGDVSVTPPAAPAGIVVKPAKAISTTGNSASFKLKIGKKVAAGPYQLTFTGEDKTGQTGTATVTVTVE